MNILALINTGQYLLIDTQYVFSTNAETSTDLSPALHISQSVTQSAAG